MTNAEKEIPKLKITTEGHQTPVDNWHEKYRELEQKEFGLWFEEAVKPDEQAEENQRLAEDNQRLKDNQKAEIPTFENAFLHNGDAWEIWFKGAKLKPIKEMDGMTYIASLLKNPCKGIHVSDLCASASRRRGEDIMTNKDLADSLKKGDMNISTMQDDGLDNKAKDELWENIQELDKIIANSNILESVREKAEKDREKIIKIANNVYGKKSLHRRAPKKVNESVKDDLDRARRAIERTRERIREQSPGLAEYLELNIKKGTEYSFNDNVTCWHISE